MKTAQRFALPACGRAWTLFGSRKNLKPEKCLKMPQTPTRQVHALLGSVWMATSCAVRRMVQKLDQTLLEQEQ